MQTREEERVTESNHILRNYFPNATFILQCTIFFRWFCAPQQRSILFSVEEIDSASLIVGGLSVYVLMA
jgi:hypothetical protein